MHIVFVYRNEENLGIGYICAVLKKGGHTVDLVLTFGADPFFGREKKELVPDTLITRILEKEPDLLALSIVTDDYPFLSAVAKKIKQRQNVPIIAGGPHVIACPERVIQEDFVNFICTGEGEQPLLELADNFIHYKKGSKLSIDGIWYKKDNTIYKNKQNVPVGDLDSLPFPDKGLFYKHASFFKDEYLAVTSRGCPNKCTYCFNWLNNPAYTSIRKMRRRSVENCIKELVWAKKKWNIKTVFFFDDSFTFQKTWLLPFLIEYKKQVSLPFSCVANLSFIDEETAFALKEAGCIKICVGVQSWNPSLRSWVLHRPETNETIINAIRLLIKTGMYVQIDHLLGIPGETMADHVQAVEFYNSLRPQHISVYWMKYYPGTHIVKMLEETNSLTKTDIKKINQGTYTNNSYLNGGSLKNPKALYGIFMLLNYLPLLPSFFVPFLLKVKFYELVKIRSFFLSRMVPKIIKTLRYQNDVSGRYYIKKFIFLLKVSIAGRLRVIVNWKKF